MMHFDVLTKLLNLSEKLSLRLLSWEWIKLFQIAPIKKYSTNHTFISVL